MIDAEQKVSGLKWLGHTIWQRDDRELRNAGLEA